MAGSAVGGVEVDRPARRLARTQRRAEIVAAASAAFTGAGYSGTGLDDVAAAAGVTRAIVYRHFGSKAELYEAVLDRARQRLEEAVGPPPYTERIIDDLLAAAAGDPAGFRLLFHHAAREPEFRAHSDRFATAMIENAREHLASSVSDPAWADWAARLAPATTITAISAWLDAGQPDPDTAAERVGRVVRGVTAAARAVGQQD